MLRPVPPVGQVPQATAELARKVHPRGTDEMRVRDALGPLFTDTDLATGVFAGMYPNLGQPGLSPALLTMVMILQFRHNLSDRDAAQAVCDRISWKYALGLELDYTGFDPSVLTEFRARLVDTGCVDALLDLMLDRLKAAGLVKAGGRQRTDSSHIIAAVRRLNRVETVGETLRSALEAIARVSPGWVVPLLEPGWDERYGRRVETSRLLRHRNASAQALAEQIGADGRKLLAAIGADPVASWMHTLPEVAVLRLVWDQQYTPDSTGRLRLRTTEELAPAAERVHSPYDPEARYSTRRSTGEHATGWVGSKVHLTESCDVDLPNLVTDVHTTAATEPDVAATTTIQDRLISRGLAPAEHVADAGYPSADNLAGSAKRDITLVAPVTVAIGRNAGKGTFTPADFQIDWDAQTATCPAGVISKPMRPDKRRGLVTFAFSIRDCRGCPIRDQCTLAKPNTPRTLTIHPQPVHEARTAAQAAQGSDHWRKAYHSRAGIEGTISQAVRGPDIRHARYRGLAKTHLQNVLTGMAINIGRLGAYLDVSPTTPRRPTRIHQLCLTYGLAAA
ncbi:MAG TPA: IS1182 family transposase [Micromonosporaceae bacterium]|nr:IS1182 family transposase [Micromonosporaceae bacterium]